MRRSMGNNQLNMMLDSRMISAMSRNRSIRMISMINQKVPEMIIINLNCLNETITKSLFNLPMTITTSSISPNIANNPTQTKTAITNQSITMIGVINQKVLEMIIINLICVNQMIVEVVPKEIHANHLIRGIVAIHEIVMVNNEVVDKRMITTRGIRTTINHPSSVIIGIDIRIRIES